MRYALLLCPLLLLSCTTTKGPVDRDMDSARPYSFACQCPKGEAMNQVKRYLVSAGFTVQNEDQEAGVMGATKQLTAAEKISTSAVTEGATGVSSAGQRGKLTFRFSTPDSVGLGLFHSITKTPVEVLWVASGSPADSAGLREGDSMLEVNGRSIRKGDQISDFIEEGESVTIKIRHDGTAKTVEIHPAKLDPYTAVVMQGRLNVNVNERQTFDTKESQKATGVIQGHPMMVLHGQGLNQNDKLNLINPKPSSLPRNEYSPQ